MSERKESRWQVKATRLIAIATLVGLLSGCASAMINEEGTGWSWYGRIVDWASPWHGSEAELVETTETENKGENDERH